MCDQNQTIGAKVGTPEYFTATVETFGPAEAERPPTPEERALRIVAIQRELEQLHADSRQPLDQLRNLQAHLRVIEERHNDLRQQLFRLSRDVGFIGFDSFSEGWPRA